MAATTPGSIRRLTVGTILFVVGACASPSVPVATGSPSPTATAAASASSPATSTAAAPAPTPLPSSSAAAIPSQAVGSWAQQGSIPGFDVRDIAARSDMIVAVGCRVPPGGTACAGGAIETSIDGGWTSASLEGDTRFLEFRAVASGAAGFVAVGHQFGSEAGGIAEAVSFTSSDGRAWRRAPEQASLHGRTLTDVVARPEGGWLAVGAEAGPTVFQGINTWTSGDGLKWTLVDAMPQVGTVHGVTTVNGGFIAWGTDCLDVCGPPERAAIWRSKDGSAWVRGPVQPSLARGQVYDIIATPTGALAVGATFDVQAEATGVAWLSADGTRWTKVALPGAARYQSFRAISTGPRYVTVGARQGDAGDVWSTWTSTDPATWIRLAEGDVRAASFDVVASDRGVIGMAVGESPEDAGAIVLRLGLD